MWNMWANKDATKFKKAVLEETLDILIGPLDYSSNKVTYLLGCKEIQSGFPFGGSIGTQFRFHSS